MTQFERSWGTIAASTSGHGDPLVLLHPLALSGRAWDPLVEFLSPRFQVVTIDARGHGESQWDGSPFSVWDLAADAAAVIEGLDLGRASVVGMSMGGCVALSLASTRPDLVLSLVLADTTANYGPDRYANWAARAEAALGVPRRDQLAFQIERWFSPEYTTRAPDEVRRICEIFMGTDSRAHAQACRALGSFDATADLARIRCPTLVLVGEDDQATPQEMAAALDRKSVV